MKNRETIVEECEENTGAGKVGRQETIVESLD